MKLCTLLSAVWPVLAGLVLLVWKPENKKSRNAYALSNVVLTSVFVLATCAAAAKNGGASVAPKAIVLNDLLSIALCPDGPSIIFGAIIGVLWPVTTIYAFSYMEHEHNLNMFFGFFLISYGVVSGIAFSGNMFTMYLFYELMTLATLPLVMHEMNGKARSAGKKYVIYSMSGAALIFIAMVILAKYGTTLDFVLGGVLDPAKTGGAENVLRLVYVLGFFGFGVKAAIFPLHDWLPSASVAPTPVTALLHAVAVVKAGAFGVMRLTYYSFGTELMRGTWAQTVVVCAAAVTIVYGSSMALRAGHLKRRLAYSTVANLSYILLGFAAMCPAGLTGGLLHMIFHAVIKIALFFCAGAILHTNSLEYIDDFERLGSRMPVTCGVFVFMGIALSGIPPLGGFISKWTIGTAVLEGLTPAGFVGAAALIISAILTMLYIMTTAIKFFFPTADAPELPAGVREADRRMTVPMLVLCVLCLVLSLCSSTLVQLLSGISSGM